MYFASECENPPTKDSKDTTKSPSMPKSKSKNVLCHKNVLRHVILK